MTELSPATAPPLRTDDDVARRVAALIGCATGNDKLWLLFVDGDDRQAPVVMPVEEMSGPPDGELVAALGDVLEGFLPDLATAAGVGFRGVRPGTSRARLRAPGRPCLGRGARDDVPGARDPLPRGPSVDAEHDEAHLLTPVRGGQEASPQVRRAW